MTRFQDLRLASARWTVVGALLIAAASAGALPAAAQSAGDGSSEAAVVDPAPDAAAADAPELQTTGAAPAAPAAPAVKPTPNPYQGLPTGC